MKRRSQWADITESSLWDVQRRHNIQISPRAVQCYRWWNMQKTTKFGAPNLMHFVHKSSAYVARVKAGCPQCRHSVKQCYWRNTLQDASLVTGLSFTIHWREWLFSTVIFGHYSHERWMICSGNYGVGLAAKMDRNDAFHWNSRFPARHRGKFVPLMHDY